MESLRRMAPPGVAQARSWTILRGLLLGTALCLASLAATAAELIVNGGFETNGGVGSQTFANWTVVKQTGSLGGFYAQSGTFGPVTSFVVEPPPAGTFSAMSDQTGPNSLVLYQDVALPAGVPANLSLWLYVQNEAYEYYAPASLDYGTIPNQQVRVDIMNPAASPFDVGAGVLRNLFVTAPGSPQFIGYTRVSSDLSAFAGQTVRIRIAEVDNQQGMIVGVDAVSVATNYVVTPSAGANGTITQSTPQTVIFNGTASFTATPSIGYHVDTWGGTCGGSASGAGNRNFTTSAVTADCTVTVNFAINTYSVTPSAGANGTISPSGVQTVNYNGSAVFTATPSADHHVLAWGGTCGGTASGPGNTSYTTAAVTANCTVTVSFASNFHSVTLSAGPHVTLAPSGVLTVADGDSLVLTATPEVGYPMVSFGGTCGGTRNGNVFTTAPITVDCTVTVSATPAHPVPTLSQWSFAVLSGVLVLLGAGLIRRRRPSTKA